MFHSALYRALKYYPRRRPQRGIGIDMKGYAYR